MNDAVLTRGNPRRRRHLPAAGGAAGDRAAEIGSVLFASLPRSDQRRKAEQYLNGLLSAQGRKSIRGIAALAGRPAAEQSLHHFISSSTWDWRPMREALARYLERESTPRAWVVRPVSIPKAGRHSVGVDRQPVCDLGQTMRAQQAFGVWFANEAVSAPVHWRMFLPPAWVNDSFRRRRADIPDSVGEETPGECAAAAVLDTVCRWGVPRRPVLLDVRTQQARPVVRRFADARVPLLARIGDAFPLVVADPAMPGHGGGALSAQRILASVRGLCRPVEWADSAAGGAVRVSHAVAVRVHLPEASRLRPTAGTRRGMLLLGEWRDLRRPPAELWLSGTAEAPAGSLLRTTKLVRRVARDLDEEGDRVGLRDFEGRSFRGWHRHMTLASAAHAAAVLGAAGREGPAYAPGLSA